MYGRRTWFQGTGYFQRIADYKFNSGGCPHSAACRERDYHRIGIFLQAQAGTKPVSKQYRWLRGTLEKWNLIEYLF